MFPPRPSMRLVRDTITFTAAEMPRWHPVSISGYHIREAGSTAVEELAFTLANGFAYVELALEAGLAVDAFAPRLSFFFNAHIDFFEEIAKYRAARRIWARWMKERYGATARAVDAAALPLPDRRGVADGASSPRSTSCAPRSRRSPACSVAPSRCTPTRWTRRSALPTEKAARIALRTQQVIANETNVAHVADPLGGSYFVEALTDEMEREAEALFAELDQIGDGSMLEGVDPRRRGELVPGPRSPTRRTSSSATSTADGGSRSACNAFTEGNDEAQIDAAARSPTRTSSASASGSTRSAHDRSPGRRRRRPRPPAHRRRRPERST